LSSRIRKIAMISSVTLPNVALISPPRRGPMCSASCSVDRPISPASGRIAPADVRKIARSGPPATSRTIAIGTRTRSQSSDGFRERVRVGVVVGTGARVDGRRVPSG
jgi:hypothetical protein